MKMASAVVSGAKLASAGLIILLNIILTRQLSVTEYGEFSTWIVYINFLGIFLILGLNTSHIYHFKNGFDNYKQLIIFYSFFIILFFLLTLIFNLSLLYVALGSFCLAGISIINADAQAQEKHINFSIQVFLQNFLIFTIISLAVYFLQVDQGVRLLKLYSYTFLTFYILLLTINLHKRVFLKNTIFNKEFWIYGANGLFLNILGQMLYSIDILIIGYLMTKDSVGVYNVAALIAKSLWLLVDSIGMVVFPKIINTTQENEKKWSIKAIKISFIFCLIPTILFFLVGKFFLVEFFGKTYEASLISAYILIIASFPLIFYKIGSRLAAARKKWKETYFSLGLSVIINIVLNFILIPHFGIEGAAISSLITYSICGFYLAFRLGLLRSKKFNE